MRLVTRGDLDGLTCAVLISHHEEINSVLLTHPQELADGHVEISSTDIIANLPYQPGCGIWFDHHMHTTAAAPTFEFEGAFGQAPSAARLVWEYYSCEQTLPHYDDLVCETDRLDSADLTLDDILDPQGYIKLGFTLDSRSGLGPLEHYFQTVLDLLLDNRSSEEILLEPAVDMRCRRLETDDVHLHEALQSQSRVDGNVVFTDFRYLDPVPAGNRFLVFAIFPQINVAVRAQRRLDGPTMLTLGHSIINRTCNTNVGELAARYGGGGHPGAGSIPLMEDTDQQIEMILTELKAAG
jgi:hypothetical protein